MYILNKAYIGLRYCDYKKNRVITFTDTLSQEDLEYLHRISHPSVYYKKTKKIKEKNESDRDGSFFDSI